MKKILLFCIMTLTLSSCSHKLVNTSTHKKSSVTGPVAAVFADLDVSSEKINYFMRPSKSVRKCGYKNVVNTAVREALLANGNADVLVAMEVQVKYSSAGKIESVTVTGYPAKYVNFRNPGDDYLRNLTVSPVEQDNHPGAIFNFGRK